MPSRKINLIVGAAIAAAFLLAELGFRLGAPLAGKYSGPPELRTDDPAELLTASLDPELVYELRSGLDVLFLGKTFQTNSFGVRGREYSRPKAPGTFRIIGLGDSVMMGWGVSQGLTYLDLLEAELGRRYPGTRIEVINFGVQGYNTVQEYLVLRDKALAYSPDLILLNYVGNDHEKQDNRRGTLLLGTPFFSLNFFILKLQALFKKTEPGVFYDWRPSPVKTVRPPAGFLEAFRAIALLARREQVPVIALLDSRYVNPLMLHSEVAAFAGILGMDCLDLFKLYRKLPETVSVEKAVSVVDAHNLKYLRGPGLKKDNHPNEAWHARTASVLAGHLISSGYIRP